MADSVENYLVLVDGKKTYTCSFCEYTTKKISDMKTHISSKKHIIKITNRPATIPLVVGGEGASPPIAVPVRIPVAVGGEGAEPLINSPPKGKLKGKTYLSKYCIDAVKIDTTSIPWGRTFEITLDDIKRWIVMTPNQYIEYFFLKLIKEIGVDKFPFRCLDKARLKFYYNDINLGWIEDLGNSQLHKLIRAVLGKTTVSANEKRKTTYDIDDEITMENLTNVMYLYNCWALPVSSIQEPERNKTDGGAKKENVNALSFLADLLDCE